MIITEQFTSQGLQVHTDGLDIAELKLNHVKKQLKSFEPNYQNILALIRLNNNRRRTVILDRRHGLIAVPESPAKILKTMTKKLEIISPWFMRQLSKLQNINEYRPYVYGGLSFSPLKTDKNGCQSWISTLQIENFHQHQNIDSQMIYFQDFDLPIIVPATRNFINNRSADASKLQLTHEVIVDALSLPVSENFHNDIRRLRASQFHASTVKLFNNAKRDIIKKAWDRAEFEYTDEDIDRLIKEQLSD
ncbi:hypothetical protein [Lentilactobacillus otakiensis]|uniref:hypothetical protein n=1 Tax=Lentilactobacillus otakiensis TaxID=481720 RepID=UPI003D164B54